MTDADLIQLANVELLPWRRDDETWQALERGNDTFDAKTGALVREGKPHGHRDNVQTILERDPYWTGRVYWDELYQRARWDDDTEAAKAIEDHDEAGIGLRMHRVYGLSATTATIHEALLWKARQDERHPVREHLEGLTWDGTPRVKTWASDYLGARGDLEAEMAWRWMVQAVARAYEPGCKADAVLILQGRQGCGKSTTLAALGGEWFRDTPMDLSSKDRFDALRGAWIYELAELDSMRRAEAQTLKAFVSSQTDSYRPSYGRNVIDLPRCCVFAGTTNDGQFLQDATGSRRWWIVPVGECRVDDLRDVVDQLWAEAVHLYQAGEPWHLSRELEEQRAAVAEAYEVTDPVMSRLQVWSDGRIDFTTSEFWDAMELGRPAGTSEAMRLSALLGKLGTHDTAKITRNGKQVRGWRIKPKA